MKWRHLKHKMNEDIRRLQKAHPDQIITNKEWIVSTIQKLKIPDAKDEDNAKTIYESGFIDPFALSLL